MADTSYLKRIWESSYCESERKSSFRRIVVTDTIGKDIRDFLTDKEFRIYGAYSESSWISLAAKYFGGKNRPYKWDNLDVYIIGPEITSSELIHVLYSTNRNTIVIKYEDIRWHIEKEFPDCKSHWNLSYYLEKKIEEKEEAIREAKRLERGIADKDFLSILPTLQLDDDSLLFESFHVIGKIASFVEEEFNVKTQKAIYDKIRDKGGMTVTKPTGKITCVIYGDDVTTDKFLSFDKDVRFIYVYHFLEWLKEARPIDRDCTVFETKYHSSSDSILRPYQQSAKDRIFILWCKYRNLLLQMPTGAGKTILFTSIIKDLTVVPDVKILILAHRKELIEQIDLSLDKYCIEHGLIVTGRKRDLDKTVQVASIQTITHKMNESILDEFSPTFIIIDEAHHSLAKTYASFWKRCTKSWKLGVTATPCRLNNAPFNVLFSDILVSSPIKEFIDNGFLSDYEFYTDNPYNELTKTIESIKEKSSTGDYKVKTLIEKLNVEKHIKQLVLCYLTYAKNLKGIVYAISVEHARNICSAYQEIGVNAEFIDSNTPKPERAEIVQRFRDNEIQIMVNVEIFSEGFDCPDVEFIQMARPTWSLSLYLQQVGRGLRKTTSNKKTIILDNSNMFEHFGLPSEKWDWIKHFMGDYRIQSIYQNYRYENAKFLRQMCKDSDDLMFRITSSQDFAKRPEVLKEHESKIAALKKLVGLKTKQEEENIDKSKINSFTTLSGAGVTASEISTLTKNKTTTLRTHTEQEKQQNSKQEAEVVSKANDASEDTAIITMQDSVMSTPIKHTQATVDNNVNIQGTSISSNSSTLATPDLDEALCYDSHEDFSSYVAPEPVIYHPTPQQGSRRASKPKRKYKMVGEGNHTPSTAPEEKHTPFIAYIFAALAIIAVCVLLFASLGFAVFLLPLLAGKFKK